MRPSPNVIVFGLIIGLLGMGAIVISLRSAKSHRDLMKDSLTAGLQQLFDKVALEKKNDAIHPDDLKSALGDASKTLLPSFVKPSEVFLADAPVKASTDGVICAVKGDNGAYLALTA